MKTLNLLESDLLLENTIYEYRNDYYTYNLKLIPEVEIRNKYEIVCSKQDLVLNMTSMIDSWIQPETYDLLELTACIQHLSTEYGKIYYLSSYLVEIKITEIHDGTQNNSDVIVLPDFQLEESRNYKGRIVKGFKNFR